MRKRYLTITLALAGALPLASSFATDTKMVKAVSGHFELYATDNEASAKAALEHFETVRAYLLKATNSQDPFAAPVRIVGFKSGGQYSSYLPVGIHDVYAFLEANPERVTIVMSGLGKDVYEYGVREYVGALLDRTAPKLPYWLKRGLTELYCTLHMQNGQLMLGAPPAKRFVLGATPNLNMSVVSTLKSEAPIAKGPGDFYATTANTAGLRGSPQYAESEYPAVLWQLTHMLMFNKEYAAKFGAYVGALADGEDSTAALERIYDQSPSGLTRDLVLYGKMASHVVVGINFQLDKPVDPQVSQLSPADAAAVLAALKPAK